MVRSSHIPCGGDSRQYIGRCCVAVLSCAAGHLRDSRRWQTLRRSTRRRVSKPALQLSDEIGESPTQHVILHTCNTCVSGGPSGRPRSLAAGGRSKSVGGAGTPSRLQASLLASLSPARWGRASSSSPHAAHRSSLSVSVRVKTLSIGRFSPILITVASVSKIFLSHLCFGFTHFDFTKCCLAVYVPLQHASLISTILMLFHYQLIISLTPTSSIHHN